MKDSDRKKELQSQYKERQIIGGVYLIRNTLKNKLLLEATLDLQGRINRFQFAQKTGSCVDMKLQNDWAEQGSGQFVLEVLEELKKGETQTRAEFEADLDLLKGIWRQKLAAENLY